MPQSAASTALQKNSILAGVSRNTPPPPSIRLAPSLCRPPPSSTSLFPLIFHRQALPEPTTTQPGKNSTESCCRASLPLTLIPSHHISISSKKQNASNHFNFFPLRRSIINAVNFRRVCSPEGGRQGKCIMVRYSIDRLLNAAKCP